MSKFNPGDTVYYMDGNTLCQAIVCVEDGQWPLVEDGFCVVYNISPEYGTRRFKHSDERQYYCDIAETSKLYKSPEELINAIKSDLKKEYDKKNQILDSYKTGNRKTKQSLAGVVRNIIIGRNV